MSGGLMSRLGPAKAAKGKATTMAKGRADRGGSTRSEGMEEFVQCFERNDGPGLARCVALTLLAEGGGLAGEDAADGSDGLDDAMDGGGGMDLYEGIGGDGDGDGDGDADSAASGDDDDDAAADVRAVARAVLRARAAVRRTALVDGFHHYSVAVQLLNNAATLADAWVLAALFAAARSLYALAVAA
ncbi:hypothetical protein HK100_009172, partial [Physocladia obscura]